MINSNGVNINNLHPEVMWIVEQNAKDTLRKIEQEKGLYFLYVATCESCKNECECPVAFSDVPRSRLPENKFEVYEGFRDLCPTCKKGVIFHLDQNDAIDRLKAKIIPTIDPLYLFVDVSETVCTS